MSDSEVPKSNSKPRAPLAPAIAHGLESCAEPFEKLGAKPQAAALRRGAAHARAIGEASETVKNALEGFFGTLAKIIPPGKTPPKKVSRR